MENLGTFNIEKALTIRVLNKLIYGKNVKMRLYGRGKRRFSMDGRKCSFGHDLPLKYAKRAIVYRYLRVPKEEEAEKKLKIALEAYYPFINIEEI